MVAERNENGKLIIAKAPYTFTYYYYIMSTVSLSHLQHYLLPLTVNSESRMRKMKTKERSLHYIYDYVVHLRNYAAICNHCMVLD